MLCCPACELERSVTMDAMNLALIINLVLLAVWTAFLVVFSIDEARKENYSDMDVPFRKAA